MRVRYTERAIEDVATILDYLHGQSPAGSNSVERALLRTVRLIQSFPGCGEQTDVPGVREVSVPRYPYKIYYALGPDAVWIIHVRDARRRPWSGDDSETGQDP